MSTHAAGAEHSLAPVVPEPADGSPRPPARRLRVGATPAAMVALAGALCFVTFLAGGGLDLAPMTTLELALTLATGVVVVGVVVLVPAGARAYGIWSVGLLLAFTALTGLSVVWSVQPDASWQDAGRMLAYSGVFAAAVALVWIAPGGWRALLAAIVLAAVAVCGYALLTKVLPDRLDATDVYARLQEPYGYWNAIGLTAAMGAIGCLWLGARRAGHALLNALAYPAMGLMIVTLMLAYSRGALAALAVGVAAWMCLVPLRLRGARVLIVGALGAGPIVAWDFSRHALSSDKVALAARTTAGHQLGVLLAAMLVVLALAGIAIGFFGDRRAPRPATRRAVGAGLGALIVLAVIALGAGLAASRRGFTGTISHDLSSLTNPNAKVPNTPGRLTAISSVRARYWKEALKIFEAHPALGAGAAGYETARLRYRTVPIDVRQAHGYVVQTLADLGIAGLALTLALLAAWMAAAGRSTHPFNRRWTHVGRNGDSRQRRVSPGLGRRPRSAGRRFPPHTRPSGSGFSRWCASWWCSACIRSSTGPGTCRATRAWRCCAPDGWPGAGRCARAIPRPGDCPRRASSAPCGWASRSRWWWGAARRLDRVAAAALGGRLRTGARPAQAQPAWPRSPRRRRASNAIRCRPPRCSGSRRFSTPPARARSRARRCSRPCACSPRTPQTWLTLGEYDMPSRPACRRGRAARGRVPRPRVDPGPERLRGSAAQDRHGGPRGTERLDDRERVASRPEEAAATGDGWVASRSEAAAASSGEQHATRARQARRRGDRDLLEAEVGEEARERAARVEAQMVGARVEARLRTRCGLSASRQPATAVRGREC